jgi:hypothetical protein
VIVNLDNNGVIKWDKIFTDREIISTKQTKDRSFIGVGTRKSKDENRWKDFWVINFNNK